MPIITYRTTDIHKEYTWLENSKKLKELSNNNPDSKKFYNHKGEIVDVDYQGHKYRPIGIKKDLKDPLEYSILIKIGVVALTILSFGTLLLSERFRSLWFQTKSYTCFLTKEGEVNRAGSPFIISPKLGEDAEKLLIEKLDSYSIHRLLMTKPHRLQQEKLLWLELFKRPIPHIYSPEKNLLQAIRTVYLNKIAQFSQQIREIDFSTTEIKFTRYEHKFIFKNCPRLEKIKYKRDFSPFPKKLPKGLISLQHSELFWNYKTSRDKKYISPFVSELNIHSWPPGLQTLSLHREDPITSQSISKLPCYLTSLSLQNANRLIGSNQIQLPPFLTHFRYNYVTSRVVTDPHLTFIWPAFLENLELGDGVLFNQEYMDLLPRSLTALRIDNAQNLSDSMAAQFSENLKSLALNVQNTFQLTNKGIEKLPNSLTSLTIKRDLLVPSNNIL